MRIIISLFISSCILASCTSTKSFFISPNSVNKTEGTIYMEDGAVKKGIINISLENEHERDNIITVKTDNDTVAEKLDLKQIKSYTIDGHMYLVKIINLYLSSEYHYLFVERLTAGNDRMQIYKLTTPQNTIINGGDHYYYYISFPHFTQYQVVDINSSKLVPLFDIKMAAYLKDCPEVQAKVAAKDKEYYYPLLSVGAKRLEVITNIAKEYNACK